MIRTTRLEGARLNKRHPPPTTVLISLPPSLLSLPAGPQLSSGDSGLEPPANSGCKAGRRKVAKALYQRCLDKTEVGQGRSPSPRGRGDEDAGATRTPEPKAALWM